jgi:hypothetical protein
MPKRGGRFSARRRSSRASCQRVNTRMSGTKATRIVTQGNAAEFQELIATGRSINWLANVVRDQGFAHGLPEGSRIDASRQWLNRQQVDLAVSGIIVRFRDAGTTDIFHRPEPLDILFCWLQLGPNKEDVRSFVGEAIRNDNGFLDALNGMRGWSSSSNKGIRYPLKRQYLEFFLDADEAKTRLEAIANADHLDATLTARAKELLQEWDDERVQWN